MRKNNNRRNQRQGLTLAQKREVRKIVIDTIFSLAPSQEEIQEVLLSCLKGPQVRP